MKLGSIAKKKILLIKNKIIYCKFWLLYLGKNSNEVKYKQYNMDCLIDGGGDRY
jgi:hypothetical protein